MIAYKNHFFMSLFIVFQSQNVEAQIVFKIIFEVSKFSGVQGCLSWAKLNGERISNLNPSTEISQLFSTTFDYGDSVDRTTPLYCNRNKFCSNNSCPSTLSCFSLVDDFECLDPSSCDSNECKFGTPCIPDDRIPSVSYECDCGLNFEGDLCEHSLYCNDGVNQCRESEECVPQLGSEPTFECLEKENEALEWFIWLIMVFSVLLLLVTILIIVCCVCRLMRSKNSHSESKVEVMEFEDKSPTANRQFPRDPVAPDLLAHVPDKFSTTNFTPVAPGVEVEEDIDETMITSSEYRRSNNNSFLFDNQHFPAPGINSGHLGDQRDYYDNMNDPNLSVVQEMDESHQRDRRRSKSSSTMHTLQANDGLPFYNTTYAESGTDNSNYDRAYNSPENEAAKGKRKQGSNFTPYIIQSQKSTKGSLERPSHEHSDSFPDYSDHSDFYRRFNNSLNPHFMQKYPEAEPENQFELTEPTLSVKTDRKTPTSPAKVPEFDQFPFNEDDEFSTRSFYQSSPRSDTDGNYEFTESEYGDQIQTSRLPNLNREPMTSEPNIYYESIDDARHDHNNVRLPGEVSPRMPHLPSIGRTSLSSQNSRPNNSSQNLHSPRSHPDSNPERFFQQGDYNPFFQGRLNFEMLAPVFQDLADLPNIPDLVENEDDDFTQSTSHFVP